MSIGKVTNYVTLVNQANPAQIKTVKVTRGVITSDSVTVTALGDDISDWAVAQVPTSGSTSTKWLLNGLAQSVVQFKYEQLGQGLGYAIYTAFVGDSRMTASTNMQLERRFAPVTPSFGAAYFNHADLFNGYGLYLVYDDSHIPDRPRYAFISLNGIESGALVIPDRNVPFTITIEKRAISGRKVSGKYIFGQRQKDIYWDGIYEHYAGTDYDPAKAKEEEIFGFPYAPDGSGESTSKGGDMDMTDTSTPILIDDAREVFVGNFFRIYALNTVNLSLLSNFLLSADFIDNIKKLYSNPMDYLINLSAMPVSSFNGATENVRIGNITSTDVSGKRLTNFFVDVNCGEISLTEYFGAFLDYSPYTSITLYAPFCGYTSLNVDSFQNDVIKIRYRVDAMTGQCVCMISNSQGLITTLSGNVAYQIPMRSADFSALFTGLCSTALNVVGGVAAGSPLSVMSGVQNFLASAPTKPSITNTGSLSSNAGTMTNKKPYIIIERPSISVPKNYGHEIGYNSYIYRKLSDTHGFTKVLSIHLDNTTATREEKAELEALLRNGVVLP